jgi:peptidase E
VHGRRPQLAYVGTAGGDSLVWTSRMEAAGRAAGVDVHPLDLFPMPPVDDIPAFLAAMDVVWVGGGSVVNLLAVWRAHRLERHLHEAWQAGVVLAGVSAGSLCWHVGGTTDSFGPDLAPVTDGLAFLPYANGVHYDSEPGRRPLLHRLIADGTLPDGYATDDGVGLVYRGVELVEAVGERTGAGAYVVSRTGSGVTEERLGVRLLPAAT